MPTKTDRILSYLPTTFRAFPRPTALYSVVDAFGSELLKAENSLAALMLTHWVDHADRGADFISDLACIAALYGLSPQGADQNGIATATGTDGPPCPPLFFTDEGVEEFREHLKRYVRTFIEGTVTVQGILRITAEALGLHIADEYTQLDSWWKRPSDELIIVEPRGEDAASLLFGVKATSLTGVPAQAARIVGTIDLSNGVDLRSAAILRIKVNGTAALEVDCSSGASNLANTQLHEVVNAINTKLGSNIANNIGHFLVLTSTTTGVSSQLEILEGNNDAAPLLLGLLPRTYSGAEAIAASAHGTVDLHGGADLSENHYLRLQIDVTTLAEVDCVGANPAATTLDEIVKAINDALGAGNVASHDGHFLTLTSPTIGLNSRIALVSAAAQDARELLFGQVDSFYIGDDAHSAQIVGTSDLSQGANLSTRDRVRIQVNNQPPLTIDCTGNDPVHTLPTEIVALLNAKLGPGMASTDGHFIRLSSSTSGSASTLVFEALPDEEDATGIIFGIVPRNFQGTAATTARFVGQPDLSTGVDLSARHIVQIAVDGGLSSEVDVRHGANNVRAVTLDEIKAALNNDLGDTIATHDGQHLILVSSTTGSGSRIDISPLETTTHQRFVTRAFVTDEAAYTILGTGTRQAQGTAATHAQVIGTVDLSRGVDLREIPFLRIALDGQPPSEIDCTSHSKRPRAATLDEVVQSINDVLGAGRASHDDRHLILTSQAVGADSRISFALPRSSDAFAILLGQEPGTFNGSDATSVSFVGTVDLSAGVDLSTSQQIKIGVDGVEAKEINCAGINPAKTMLNELVNAINQALGGKFADQDGIHILLNSTQSGSNSTIEFAVPAGADATKAIFGIAAPRKYHGAEATPALVVGNRDLGGPIDLHLAHFLRIALNSQLAVDIDCTANAPDPAAMTLAQIMKAINDVLGLGTATSLGTRLVLTTTTTGIGARIDLQPYTVGDARTQLLGSVPASTIGAAPIAATLVGDVELVTPVDLDGQRTLRLAIDGEYPLDIDVAGAAPAQTTLDEIIANLNNTIPGLASADNNHLRLTSPTASENSQLELLPLRTLALIEYPAIPKDETPLSVRHGNSWFEINDSGVDADLAIDLSAPQGASCPSLVNFTSGTQLRFMISLRTDELIQVCRDPMTGLRATITASDGTQTQVPGAKILAGPLGSQAQVPFKDGWQLRGGTAEKPATLQLNNPRASALVMLRKREGDQVGNSVTVMVTQATLSGSTSEPVVANGQSAIVKGWLRKEPTGYRLIATADTAGVTLAHLRASRAISLETYLDSVVVVYGPLHMGDDAPVMIVNRIADLFDVAFKRESKEGNPPDESYPGVTIGTGTGVEFPESLTWQITTRPSQLVRANEIDKGSVLVLPQGRSKWIYLDGGGSRFDAATLGDEQGEQEERADTSTMGTIKRPLQLATFAKGCQERAVFNISRFTNTPAEQETTVLATGKTITDPAVALQFHWMRHQPGAFVVNLPDDLPERFGSRFNQTKFGIASNAPEEYKNVVTEPKDDPGFIGTQLAPSKLVVADSVATVPPGWAAMTIPFYHPRIRTFTGGTDTGPAMLFLQEAGAQGFIRLQAKQAGVWGNAISVTVRKGTQGPAYFDVTITYAGARLENARQTVLGGKQLPTSGDALLNPGPIGILQAKATGVQAGVTRQRT
ncbi:MAG: hypothetical protein ABI396_04190 [Ktedonobacteraceae bacterium]